MRLGRFHRCVRAPPLDGDIEQPAGVAAAGELSGVDGWMDVSSRGNIELWWSEKLRWEAGFPAGALVFVTEAFVKKCARAIRLMQLLTTPELLA